MKKDKYMVFFGGSLHSEQKMRREIVPRAKKIEKIIFDCGFNCSLNMLGNENIFSHEPLKKHPDFSNGQSFLKVGNRLLKKISDRSIELVRGLRHFEDQEEFKTALMAYSIIRYQLERSICGIFEISAASQGSVGEIISLIEVFEKPVLALSHNNFGLPFPVILTGHPSIYLRTTKYDDNNLEDIIKDFLLVELPKRKMKTTSVMLSAIMHDQAKERSKQENISLGDLIRKALDHYLTNGALKPAMEKYVNFMNYKFNEFCKSI